MLYILCCFISACHSSCDVGLMRCTGTASADCCVAFEDNGDCSPDLDCNEKNFVANQQNEYICGESKLRLDAIEN